MPVKVPTSSYIASQYGHFFDSHILECLKKLLGQDEAIKIARHCKSHKLDAFLANKGAYDNQVRLNSEDDRKIFRSSICLNDEVRTKHPAKPLVMQFHMDSRRFLGKKYVKLSTGKDEEKSNHGQSEREIKYHIKQSSFNCCYLFDEIYKLPASQRNRIIQHLNHVFNDTEEVEIEMKRLILNGTCEEAAGNTALSSILNLTIGQFLSLNVTMTITAGVFKHASKIKM